MSLLTVERMTRYFGGLCAVSDFNLIVEPGELIGIIGPNGAGKTTVFNLLTGVYPVSTGRIEFNGQDLAGLPPHRITSLGIARTFQNIRLFKSLSVLDNIRAAHYARLRYNPLAASLHCGRRFRVQRRLERMFLEESQQVRSLKHTVLLAGVHCGGDGIGCDRQCFYFWREAWLRRVPPESIGEHRCL